MTWNTLIALLCAAIGGACLHRGFVLRRRRKPRLLIIDYEKPPAARIVVNACACNACKNVIWAQRVEIEAPMFCAYCGIKFNGRDETDDEGIRNFIVSD